MQAANPPTSVWARLSTQPPLMWFSLAFLGGIVFGKAVSLSLLVWIGFALAVLFLSILARIILPRLNLSSLRQGSGQVFVFLPFIFINFNRHVCVVIFHILGNGRNQSDARYVMKEFPVPLIQLFTL